jgi:hypothetical protein
MYPDYCLVQATKPAKRQVEKAEFSFSLSRKPVRQAQIYTYAHSQQYQQKSLKSLLTGIFLLILFVSLAVAGTISYRNMQAEKKYARYFILALYEIKGGADRGLDHCVKISADWKAKMDVGQSFTPRLGPDEEFRAGKLKDEIDMVMQQLSKPPQKYGKTNESLARLYGTYTALNALALAPPGNLQVFTVKFGKLQTDYKLAMQELKANLPVELTAEIEKAKAKYKSLRDF